MGRERMRIEAVVLAMAGTRSAVGSECIAAMDVSI